jgi:hypothetical protein
MTGVHIEVRNSLKKFHFILEEEEELTSNKLMLNSLVISKDVRANHMERQMLEFDQVNKSR